MADAPRQMSAEVRMAVAILSVRAVADAVGEDGFETIVYGTPHVGSGIQHHTGHLLSYALPHEVRFARVDLKPFFESDSADVNMEATNAALQRFAAREDEIIGIARVGGVKRRGQGRRGGSPVGKRRGLPRRGKSARPAANGGR